MSIARTRPRRPSIESLEVRAVPAIDLSVVGAEINAAYATFAASLRQSQAPLNTAGADVTAATITLETQAEVATLQAALASDLAAVPAASALIAQQLGPSGLSGQLAGIYSAGVANSATQTFPATVVSTVYQAVEDAILSSYQQTAADVFLASAPTPSASSPLAPVANPYGPGVTLQDEVLDSVFNLANTLGDALATVPTASTLIRQQLLSPGLVGQFTAILQAAVAGSADGSVPLDRQPALFRSVDLTLLATYQHAAGTIYLDAASQANPSAVALGTIGAAVDADFSAVAAAIRAAEVSFDTPGAEPRISAIDAQAEATANATAFVSVPVGLSGSSMQTITVDYATADGTAIAGTDYTATSGTLTFTPLAVTETIPVTILANPAASGTRTFTLNLTGPTNATISAGSATVTIDAGTTMVP